MLEYGFMQLLYERINSKSGILILDFLLDVGGFSATTLEYKLLEHNIAKIKN